MEFWSRIKEIILPPQSSRNLLQEKRLSPRVRCDIEAVLYRSEDEAFSGKIVDVGVSGMRLESPRAQKNGDRISVRVSRGQGLHTITKFEVDKILVEVRWCRKKKKSSEFQLGVKYVDTEKNLKGSWVTFVLNKFGFMVGTSFQKRKDIRASSKLPVHYELKTGSMHQGVVYNIGLGGVLLTGSIDLPAGSEIKLKIGPYNKLPSLMCHGKVVRKKFSLKVNLWMTGVSFYNQSDQDLKLLGDYILTVLRESEVKE
jgi:c-di-GMP-binding flagellar brake protein YcgR